MYGDPIATNLRNQVTPKTIKYISLLLKGLKFRSGGVTKS